MKSLSFFAQANAQGRTSSSVANTGFEVPAVSVRCPNPNGIGQGAFHIESITGRKVEPFDAPFGDVPALPRQLTNMSSHIDGDTE